MIRMSSRRQIMQMHVKIWKCKHHWLLLAIFSLLIELTSEELPIGVAIRGADPRGSSVSLEGIFLYQSADKQASTWK